jgi:hypothetical protein
MFDTTGSALAKPKSGQILPEVAKALADQAVSTKENPAIQMDARDSFAVTALSDQRRLMSSY